MKKIILIAVCCMLPLIVIVIISALRGKQIDRPSQQTTPLGETIPTLGREHVPDRTKVTTYNSNPPTSGDHWPKPAEWGIYLSPLPDEQLVHNLDSKFILDKNGVVQNIDYKIADENYLNTIREIVKANQ